MEEWITVDAAAQLLGVSRSAVYKYEKAGRLEGRRQRVGFGTRLEVSRASVEALRAEMEQRAE